MDKDRQTAPCKGVAIFAPGLQPIARMSEGNGLFARYAETPPATICKLLIHNFCRFKRKYKNILHAPYIFRRKTAFQRDILPRFLPSYFYSHTTFIVFLVLCNITKERDKDYIAAVGRRLRQLREVCGLSMEKVLFLKNIYLFEIEDGRRNITVSTLIALCEAYAISLYEFYKGLEYNDTADTQ